MLRVKFIAKMSVLKQKDLKSIIYTSNLGHRRQQRKLNQSKQKKKEIKIRMAINGRENRKLINKIKKTKSFKIKIVE